MKIPVARIYKPAKSAMQSGMRNTKHWVLEFDQGSTRFIEHIMGWTGNTSTTGQVRLSFDSKEDAVRFAEIHHMHYKVHEPKARIRKPKSYADNFSYDRVTTYTTKRKTASS